jgi:DNA-binding transcriptional LysR family regulator
MNVMHINQIDLNLLHIFDVLLDERSVTRAGARLGLSQSAVSHALNRLRHIFADELFQRTAQGMKPTARALEIGPRVHAALAQLQVAVSPPTFDPSTTERRFVLMAGAYACATLAANLVARLMETAPRAQLVIATAADLLEQLDSLRADFGIATPTRAPDRLAHEPLLRESLVWTVNVSHPLAAMAHVTLDDLLATPHVVIADREVAEVGRSGPGDLVLRPGWEDLGAFEAELRSRGLRRSIGVVVPDVFSALAVVRRSQMAALVPRRLALMSAQTGFLAMIEPPYPSPTVDVGLLYLRERLAEPGIHWMRDLVRQVAREVTAAT